MNKPDIKQYHLHKQHPEKLQFALHDLKSYRKINGTKTEIPHSHSYYQIIWFLENETHQVDFQKFEVRKNEVVVIDKNQIHAFDNTKNSKGWLLHFNESLFDRFESNRILKNNVYNSREIPIISLNGKFLEKAKTYCELITEEIQDKTNTDYAEIIRSLLKLFLINLKAVKQENALEHKKQKSTVDIRYFNFIELVEANYKEHLSLEDYTQKLSCSLKTLSNITYKAENKSPKVIVDNRLLLEIKRRLHFTNLLIKEIAFEMGFKDVSNFNKFFKKHLNTTPLQFRKQLDRTE